MLLAAICSYALVHQQTPARKEGPSSKTLLAIYQQKNVELNPFGASAKSDSARGKSTRYDRLGLCAWKVLDGGIGGVPCRVYSGDGICRYTVNVKNTAMREYHD